MNNPAVSGAQILDGKATAAVIRAELKQQLQHDQQSLNETYQQPGLAVLLIGDRRDSKTYVRMKRKACEEVGIRAIELNLSSSTSTTQEQVLEHIREWNEDSTIHGILVQLPLPSHLDEDTILSAIAPDKDVDGLHPMNCAKLMKTRHRRKISWHEMNFNIPCTPQGCLELLDRYNIPVTGKKAVVLGRSNIVGLPMFMLLMQRNATVTICHSRTENLEDEIRQADILVAAMGKPEFIRGEWLKPGVVVLDVGINSVDAPDTKKGYRLVGDVHFESAKEVAGISITPVPGGIGPLTIAMLLQNTIQSAKRQVASS